MIRNISILSLLFILYEGLYLLSEKYVVIPGTFRMLDSIFIILPVSAVFFPQQILGVFRRFGEESYLILAACAMVLIGPLMAQVVFDQPYTTGLMLMRHNLCYLCFFIFILLLRPGEQMEKTIRSLAFLMCIYVFLLLLTKRNHNLGLIHFREGYYGGGGFSRFGESRLFFPDGSLFILFYCISLARLLHPRKGEMLLKRCPDIGLALLVMYATVASYTRILVFSLLVVTVIALITAKSRAVRNVSIVIAITVVSLQSLAMFAGGGIPFIENSKLGRMALQSNDLAKEGGREMQWEMDVNNFLKSPITGVGNLASGKYDILQTSYKRTFRKYGFFNANDLGYPKIAAENGLAGLAWVAWIYSYFYRRSREVISNAVSLGDQPTSEAIGRGIRYFLFYLVISGVTIDHFFIIDGIPDIVLALAILAVTRESLSRQISSSRLISAGKAA